MNCEATAQIAHAAAVRWLRWVHDTHAGSGTPDAITQIDLRHVNALIKADNPQKNALRCLHAELEQICRMTAARIHAFLPPPYSLFKVFGAAQRSAEHVLAHCPAVHTRLSFALCCPVNVNDEDCGLAAQSGIIAHFSLNQASEIDHPIFLGWM